jgi:hypothetical protein
MKSFNDNKNYHEFNVDEIIVFIHKSLLMSENIEIRKSLLLPLLGSSFSVSGIYMDYKYL